MASSGSSSFPALPDDPRRKTAAATARNREPLLDVLKRVLPSRGTVVEAASGTGEHAVYFASALPALQWQPTDVSAENLTSIAAWTEAIKVDNVLPPLELDLSNAGVRLREGAPFAAGFCANLIHIAPWRVCENLMEFMGAQLMVGSPLVLYGPFKVNNQHTSESNAQFEQWLLGLNPEFGVRDRDAVNGVARRFGLDLDQVLEMPANNQSLVFRKR